MLVWEPDILVHICNSSSWQAEARRSQIQERTAKGGLWAFCRDVFILFRHVLEHKPLSKRQGTVKMCVFELKRLVGGGGRQEKERKKTEKEIKANSGEKN